MGELPGVQAFIIIVLGGMGSVGGSIIGGILLGIVQGLGVGFLPDPNRALPTRRRSARSFLLSCSCCGRRACLGAPICGWNSPCAAPSDARTGFRRCCSGGIAAPAVAGPYWMHVGALAWYYALLAASWALLAGYAGQFSFAHVAFAALGGYGSALLTLRLGMPLALAIPLTVLLAMVFGALMGALVLRLSGPYLALFTLAIAEIFRLMLVAEEDVTRGSLGLRCPACSRRLRRALLLSRPRAGGACAVGDERPATTRVGFFLRAIREDEGAAQASGVNTTLHKIIVFVITAASRRSPASITATSSASCRPTW